MKSITLGVVLSWLAGSPASATGPAIPDRNSPMQVRLVHDSTPGCAPNCLEWIEAEGKIVPETRIAFERLLRSLGPRRPPIFVDSGGGSVNDAMAIGRLVRARHLDVVVTRTLSEPCVGKDSCIIAGSGGVPARPVGFGAICASACTLILAAGSKRAAAPWTAVGVHQIVQTGTRVWKKKFFRVFTRTVDGVKVVVDRQELGERIVSTEHFREGASQTTYKRVSAYLADMGVKPSLMPLMLATPPSGVHWLSREEDVSTALVTDAFDGNYLATEARMRPPIPGEPTAHLAASVPEDAMLVDPSGNAPRQTITHGRVTWTLARRDPLSIVAGSSEHLVLGATIAIPQVQLGLDIRIAPETYDRADAPLLVDVTFKLANESKLATGSVRKIERIWPLQARSDTPPQTTTLDGTAASTGPMSFQIRLARKTGEAVTTSLIMDRRWIVIPVLVDGLRFVDVRVEHGLYSTPLLKRAFAAWNHDAAPTKTPDSAHAQLGHP